MKKDKTLFQSKAKSARYRRHLNANDQVSPRVGALPPQIDILGIKRIYPLPQREIKFVQTIVDTQISRIRHQ